MTEDYEYDARGDAVPSSAIMSDEDAARAVENGWTPDDTLQRGLQLARLDPDDVVLLAQNDGGATRYAPDRGVIARAMNEPAPARTPDPHIEYVQSSGQMIDEDEKGNRTVLGTGYAGAPEALNDPEKQDKKHQGPLPRGKYAIGPQQDNGDLRQSLRLTPDPANEMYNRSGFLIHGPHDDDKRDSSTGCPVFSKDIRDKIANSGRKVLRVVR